MVRARTIGVRAAPVPVMAVQVCGPSAVWIDRTALAPSPTAEATRFTEVRRTSPAANTVGMLVSNGSGVRPSAAQVAPSSSGYSWASVRMNPALSRARFPSHSVSGRAPMKQNRPAHRCSDMSPLEMLVRVIRCSDDPPDRPVTSVSTRIVTRGSARSRPNRYDDMVAATSDPRTAKVTWQLRDAKNRAACPAELAPPTTVTGSVRQALASSSVAAVDSRSFEVYPAVQRQRFVVRASSDQHGAGLDGGAVTEHHTQVLTAGVQVDHPTRAGKLGTEFHRLQGRPLGQFLAAEPGGETEIVLDAGAGGGLPADAGRVQDNGVQTFRGTVNGGG